MATTTSSLPSDPKHEQTHQYLGMELSQGPTDRPVSVGGWGKRRDRLRYVSDEDMLIFATGQHEKGKMNYDLLMLVGRADVLRQVKGWSC